MKRFLFVVSLLALCLLLSQSSFAQPPTATQTVSFVVNAVSKISVDADPPALTITEGTAGVDALTAVGDSSTSYSITHNNAAPLSITAQIASTMPSGVNLQIKLYSTKGTTSGHVDISSATTAVNVVTGIARGADANQQIAYILGANASAGTVSDSRVVTLTLTP